MSARKTGLTVTHADPWLERERPPLPERLLLVAAYEVQRGDRALEQALFLREEGAVCEIWAATFWDLSPVLAWTDASHSLRRPALAELHALPADRFGRILRFVSREVDEGVLAAVVESVLHVRSRHETAGKSLHCGLLPERAYAGLWEELQEQLEATCAPEPIVAAVRVQGVASAWSTAAMSCAS